MSRPNMSMPHGLCNIYMCPIPVHVTAYVQVPAALDGLYLSWNMSRPMSGLLLFVLELPQPFSHPMCQAMSLSMKSICHSPYHGPGQGPKPIANPVLCRSLYLIIDQGLTYFCVISVEIQRVSVHCPVYRWSIRVA